ncbi:FAD-dependent oxidoreductase [Globicatella sulfidifaciens]|uniref:FAD-dependent oxidoreductase n=1 Tax=Globicatella sulfidifaciens TaxID=136093 RepID=UPI002891DD57|nr:FAD-dependent oxidoreductase [Globicatella sulfidifaciens]MDT2767702.1 FAD-dependent oxidoreductase [Globicatella sulfidifaciens]
MKIVIIGSVAAGTSVAAKARRNSEENQIVVYDRGKDISYSVCGIPYQIGGEVESIDELVPRDAAWFKRRYNVDIHTEHEVLSIDHERRMLTVKNLQTGQIVEDHYDKLVFATGASPFIPSPFNQKDYVNLFSVRTIQDNREINQYIEQNNPKKAVIVGSGFIGLEMAEQLTNKEIDVTIVELGNQVMASMDRDMAYRVETYLAEKQIKLLLNDSIKKIEGEAKIESLITHNGQQLVTDMVFLAVGERPNTQLATEIGVELGPTKAIKVDPTMQTNLEDVYAVGDVAESFSVITGKAIYRPMGSTANKMGRIAGEALSGGTLTHRGVLGTGIFRMFDLHVGQTGLTEKEAKSEGIDYETLYNLKPSRATYLGGKEMVIKAIANRADRTLLGVQIIGFEGVDKRIDVFATAITFGAKVEDLFHLDLAYSPVFSTTKDPVMYTGMVLENAMNDRPLITAEKLIALQKQGISIQIIDARAEKDYLKSHVDQAIHIPLAHLRERLGELDKSVMTITYCNKGVTGNAAQNILINHGFEQVYNLSGGNKTYQLFKELSE